MTALEGLTWSLARPIAIGCDHAGVVLKDALKQYVTEQGYTVLDCGCHSAESVDYPSYGAAVADAILVGKAQAGILICGSGVGVSIAANRFNGIRAVLANDLNTALWSRRHNNANVLCLGARFVAEPYARDITQAWLAEPYEGERHDARVSMLDTLQVSGTPAACSV